MATSSRNMDVECPVCHKDITEAKFLPCGHVTSRKCILSWLAAGGHLCGVCDVNVAATSFCLDCSFKLCSSCIKAHKKLPITSDHRLEVLDTLIPGHKPEPMRVKPEPVSGKPTEAEMAKILKVGDRVKRGRDWKPEYGDQDCRGPGTVTRVGLGCEAGLVHVQWDAGAWGSYGMGAGGRYDLDLV